jgi:hypothetical protein
MPEQQGEYKTAAGRKSGYYWIKFQNEWRVGHCWGGDRWTVDNWVGEINNDDISKINEDRIKTPDEI